MARRLWARPQIGAGDSYIKDEGHRTGRHVSSAKRLGLHDKREALQIGLASGFLAGISTDLIGRINPQMGVVAGISISGRLMAYGRQLRTSKDSVVAVGSFYEARRNAEHYLWARKEVDRSSWNWIVMNVSTWGYSGLKILSEKHRLLRSWPWVSRLAAKQNNLGRIEIRFRGDERWTVDKDGICEK